MNQLVDQLRVEKGGAYQAVKVVLSADYMEKQMKVEILVEDSFSKDREFSYNDFLCHIHKLIRTY